jgi:site-specific DNA-methyltransferase (cytosine-N4-specific)
LKIMQGDSMSKLRELADESVDCVVVSFPYYQRAVFPKAMTVFGDRNCHHDWEARQIKRRATRPRTVGTNRPNLKNAKDIIESGTCRKCGAERVMLGWEDDESRYIEHLVQISNEVRRVLKPTGVFWINIDDRYGPDGGLLRIPQRLADAISQAGWIFRLDAIWQVQARAPDGAVDRLTRTHEYLFMFVKQKRYYFDRSVMHQRGPTGTVWPIPNERVEGHPCPFPKALVEPMVLSSCPPGGVCLDPLAGSGTTGLVALAHGRKAILIEADPEFCALAKSRIETELERYKTEIANRGSPNIKMASRRRH